MAQWASSSPRRSSNVKNGGDGGGGPAFWVSVVAVGIAGTALIMTAREHRAFMQQQAARARFKFAWRVETDAEKPGLDKPFVISGLARPVIRIQITNEGNRAAEDTLVNVLVPAKLSEFKWCRHDASELPDPGTPPAEAPGDLLKDGAGNSLPTQFLDDTIARVPRNSDYLLYFSFVVTPPDDATEWSIPLAVTAQADAMPEEVGEYEDEVLWPLRYEPPK